MGLIGNVTIIKATLRKKQDGVSNRVKSIPIPNLIHYHRFGANIIYWLRALKFDWILFFPLLLVSEVESTAGGGVN